MNETVGTEPVFLIGSEPLRRHFAGRRGDAIAVDCAAGDPADAVNASGLFPRPLWITGLELLDDKRAARLAEALAAHHTGFVAQGEKLGAPAARHLGKVGEIRRFTLTGAGGAATVQSIGTRLGVGLDVRTARHLLERLAHDPGRLVGTLEALSAGGFDHPTLAQIDRLAGSSSEHGLPWDLLAGIERGDMATVRRVLADLDVIPAIGFMTKRALLAQILVENEHVAKELIEDVLGEVSDAAVSQAGRLGRRLGAQGCRQLLAVLAKADLLAKRSRPREAAVLVSGHLARHLRGV